MRSFDREDLKPRIDRREVALLVDQVANELLGLEMQTAARVGVVDIPTCMIATYTAQPITLVGSVYKSTLPAYPIHLPMDMGVWSVSSESSGIAFIPIKTDFWDLLASEDEGLLEDQVGFFVEGRTITYTKNPLTSTAKIKLLIINPALLGEHDPYPVPPDMEMKIIEKVLVLLHSRGLAPEKPKG